MSSTGSPSPPAGSKKKTIVKWLDRRLWLRMQSLFIPGVSLLAVLRVRAADPAA